MCLIEWHFGSNIFHAYDWPFIFCVSFVSVVVVVLLCLFVCFFNIYPVMQEIGVQMS